MNNKIVNIPFEMLNTINNGLTISFDGYQFSKKTGNKNYKYQENKLVEWKCKMARTKSINCKCTCSTKNGKVIEIRNEHNHSSFDRKQLIEKQFRKDLFLKCQLEPKKCPRINYDEMIKSYIEQGLFKSYDQLRKTIPEYKTYRTQMYNHRKRLIPPPPQLTKIKEEIILD
jgi:hypothetical protein